MTILKLKDSNTSEIINQACHALKAGGIVIYPTETVYGLGVDATNQKAVNKLLRYKTRREGKPISIVVTNKEMAAKYIKLNNQARKIIDRMLPGPYTVVANSLNKLAKGIRSEYGTLGIRIPDHKLI